MDGLEWNEDVARSVEAGFRGGRDVKGDVALLPTFGDFGEVTGLLPFR